MLCEPPVREEVENVAIPAAMVPVPSVVLPSRNVTVPVAPLVTVAVNVTLLPQVLGFAELVTAVVVPALLTVSVAAVVVAEPHVLVKTARY